MIGKMKMEESDNRHQLQSHAEKFYFAVKTSVKRTHFPPPSAGDVFFPLKGYQEKFSAFLRMRTGGNSVNKLFYLVP